MPGIHRRHVVDVVGADGQRDLRELRAVERPVHLDRRNVRHHVPRDRDRLHVVVARRRRCAARCRVAAARMPGDHQPVPGAPSRARTSDRCAAPSAGRCTVTTLTARPAARATSIALAGGSRRSSGACATAARPASRRRCAHRVGRSVERDEIRQREPGDRNAARNRHRGTDGGNGVEPYRAARRRRGTHRRCSRGGSACSGASTCTSKTRTNVVFVPCIRRRTSSPATPTAIRSGVSSSCCGVMPSIPG